MRNNLKGHTQGELVIAVRQEKLALIVEKRYLTSQLKAIDARLSELDVAEGLLEDEF
jgi:hypothetical protein